MLLEPVLLGASLRAVLRNVLHALGTGVERDELLVELAIFLTFAVLLVLHHVLELAFFVLTLADVYQLVAWGLDLAIFLRGLLRFFSLDHLLLVLLECGHLLRLRELLVMRELRLLLRQLVVVVVDVAEAARVHYRLVVHGHVVRG